MNGLRYTKPDSPDALRKAADWVAETLEPAQEEYPIGSSALPDVRTGEMLIDQRGDKYEFIGLIGQGGMGSVYKVREERTGIILAMKFLNPDMRDAQTAIKRFELEIRVLGQINNPFILSAHDVARFQIGGKEMVGLVTEFVNGPTLEEEMEKEGRLEPKRLVTLAGQILIALESLREYGIVHRDIKPGNIFLEYMPDGEQIVRLGDFGIVSFDLGDQEPDRPNESLRKARLASLTESETIVGTPKYMAPEAIKRGKVDHRGDLYSFGAMLYEMAVGRPPFASGDGLKVIRQHVTDIPESFLRQGVEDVPEWIEDIVLRLLEKEPEDRFQSAAEVFAALKNGVAKDYPKLLNEIPFIWNIEPQTYDDTSLAVAA